MKEKKKCKCGRTVDYFPTDIYGETELDKKIDKLIKEHGHELNYCFVCRHNNYPKYLSEEQYVWYFIKLSIKENERTNKIS